HKQAWNVLVWFATLVTMADGLNKVGFLKWFAGGAAEAMSGYSVMTIVILLTVVYFVVHYMFASLTAHTTALLPVLLTAAIAVPGMAVKLISLLFCYTLGLMGIISPYATGPGPIYYGSGYVSPKEFLTFGFRIDLSGGGVASRRALPPLLLELGVRSVQKEERARLAREFLFFLIKSGTICTSR